MSIFNKVRELFYGRPKKLVSNSTRGERGQYGEDLAVDYCKRTLGFQVIARNWRYKSYELGIACLDAGVVVFVEVRARAADALVRGYHSIDKHISEFYNGARRLTLINCKILPNTSVLM